MASTLRRRVPSSDTPSETPTPRDESPDKPEKPKLAHHHRPKTRKRRNTAIFLLGSLFGIIAAGFFAKSNDLIDFPEIGELSMDSFLDVLPAGLVKDMRELVVGYVACLEMTVFSKANIVTLPRLVSETLWRATTLSRLASRSAPRVSRRITPWSWYQVSYQQALSPGEPQTCHSRTFENAYGAAGA